MATTPAPITEEQRFSTVVRSATTADHRRAAASGFMSALFRGDLPQSAYALMLVQHHCAYVVLERAGDDLADHPVAGAFVDDALRRAPALEADLEALVGADWSDRLRPGAATVAYCDRMAEVCVAAPERFVAHHYTRYMGDLSGGLMIGRIARERFGLHDGSGARFFEFPSIPDPAAYKERYRQRLDDAAWTLTERRALLDEVRRAYRLNTRVFDELDAELVAGPATGPVA